MTIIEWFTLINFTTVVLNLIIFGLALKLYTEILKDKAQDKRMENDE